MSAQLSSTVQLDSRSSSPITVNRLGYGTMRLTGAQIWGKPTDRPNAIKILQKAVASGINYIDTADFYGPGVTNRLIAEALYPYPSDLVIGTKVGAKRRDDKSWNTFIRPNELRQSVENNLKELKQDQLSLVHLRMMDGSDVPFKESLEAMFEMQDEGKIAHVGLSNVTKDQLQSGLEMGDIASVQNLFGYSQRTTVSGHAGGQGGQQVLAVCEENEIPLIPYFSLATAFRDEQKKLKEMAQKYGLSTAQMNIAWLMNFSDWILPIPGTTCLDHLQENIEAAQVTISDEDMQYLED